MEQQPEIMEKIKLKPSAMLVQIIATIFISFFACQTGFVCAWPSGTIENFKSNNTVLSEPMTTFEVSLLGSLLNIGALIVTPFCAYAFNNFGRKYASILFGLPFVINWLIILLTRSVPWVLVAITISGIGIGGQNASVIFISEIVHDSIRGGLTALSSSGYLLGLLVGYAVGGYLTYYQVIYANMAMAVTSMGLLLLLPESPVYLVLVGKRQEAAKSIAFYNRLDASSKEVHREINRIRLQLDPRLERILEAEQDPEAVSRLLTVTENTDIVKPHSESAWKILRKSKSSKRALFVNLVLMGSTIMMGCPVIQVYAEPLFRQAVPSMSPNQGSVLLAGNFFIASIVCVGVIDRFGRKNLMLGSSLGAGASLLLLGAQLQRARPGAALTALLIYSFSFCFTMGCGVIPQVLNGEIFLPEVRSLCTNIVLSSQCISMFIELLVFNLAVELIGMGPVFYCFSAVCFFVTVFSYIALPETKGLSTDAIQALFLKKKT